VDPVIKAVRVLRQHLGDSQQAFANRLGLSIRAIANYEKDRKPTGMALASLAREASKADRMDLVNTFMTKLMDELGLQDIPFRLMSSYRSGERFHGLILAHLHDLESIKYALTFWDCLDDLDSTSPDRQARARRRLRKLQAEVNSDPERQIPEWALALGNQK
jgi:transcriptional regulator with XRE-family HTH domain